MSFKCRICGNSTENKIHIAREMMFGTRDNFDYIECVGCGTVQISDIPDLSRYYPKNYYSLATTKDDRPSIKRRIAARLISRYHLSKRGVIGKRLAESGLGIATLFPHFLRNFPGALDLDTKILDFGSGDGQLLRTLSIFGFRSLTGVDAFIASDMEYTGGVRIYKKELKDLDPSFELIMLHHSFEHLPDPKGTLSQIHRLLDQSGTALIRIPIINYAWEKYGVNWVQLDPPRHLFLYTESSFRQIAVDSGFEISKVVYDSEAFQFYASEQYAMNIPMNDPKSFCGPSETSIFSQEQIDAWTLEAERLNKESRGDQACFYLKKLG